MTTVEFEVVVLDLYPTATGADLITELSTAFGE